MIAIAAKSKGGQSKAGPVQVKITKRERVLTLVALLLAILAVTAGTARAHSDRSWESCQAAPVASTPIYQGYNTTAKLSEIADRLRDDKADKWIDGYMTGIVSMAGLLSKVCSGDAVVGAEKMQIAYKMDQYVITDHDSTVKIGDLAGTIISAMLDAYPCKK
jgi:hypothetical protein